MKIQIKLRDGDSIKYYTSKQCEQSVANIDLTNSERQLLTHIRENDVNENLAKWIECGEYVRIEFDLDAGTATVLPV